MTYNKGHPLIGLTECLTKTAGPQQKFIRLTISCKCRVTHCCVVIHLVKTAVSLHTCDVILAICMSFVYKSNFLYLNLQFEEAV